ncbi:MAG: DUF1059 domain-containing protein [Anaerolineales bacterium]
MIKYECKNLVIDCDYVAMSTTSEEVMDMVMAHIVDAHADMLKELTPEQADDLNTKLEFLTKNSEVEEIVSDADEGDDEIFGFDDEDDDDEFEDLEDEDENEDEFDNEDEFAYEDDEEELVELI